MQYQNYDQWNELAKKVQEPFQAMTELNLKTLQSLNYLKPEDLSCVKNPEELIEKQIHLAVENGYKTLDYMQESFKIFEHTMSGLVKESKDHMANTFKK